MRYSAILAILVLTLILAPAAATAEDALDVAAFTKMRMDYANSPDFSPMWKTEPEREKFFEALKNKDIEKALSISEQWLQKCPVDAEMHAYRGYICRDLGDLKTAFYHLHMYYGLLASVAASGDGRSTKTAWKVISVSEEYYLLREIGAKRKEQALIDGKYDQMVCDLKGREVTYYFDVSISMAWIHKSLKPAN